MSDDDQLKYKEALLAETREELQKADSKASILLAAAGIVLAALLTAIGQRTWTPNRLHNGDARLAVWFAMGSALLGICFLGSAVKPRLRQRAMDSTKLHYFGNVRAYWPNLIFKDRDERFNQAHAEFRSALRKAATSENYDARLDDQIWFLGRIAFRKYRFITISIWLFAIAIALGLVTILLETY